MQQKSKKTAQLIENISEATTACLVTMVQGNLIAIGLSHWIIASQTGITAGVITSAALLIWKNASRWAISLALGVITAVVDFYMHPGMIGSLATEAVITGAGAAALSYLVGTIIAGIRRRRDNGSGSGDVVG